MLDHGWQTIPERGVVRLGHVNHIHFGGHQPYLWNVSVAVYTSVDGQCDKLVTVSVTSLSYWPSTEVDST